MKNYRNDARIDAKIGVMGEEGWGGQFPSALHVKYNRTSTIYMSTYVIYVIPSYHLISLFRRQLWNRYFERRTRNWSDSRTEFLNRFPRVGWYPRGGFSRILEARHKHRAYRSRSQHPLDRFLSPFFSHPYVVVVQLIKIIIFDDALRCYVFIFLFFLFSCFFFFYHNVSLSLSLFRSKTREKRERV